MQDAFRPLLERQVTLERAWAPGELTDRELYRAIAMAVRERLLDEWGRCRTRRDGSAKLVYYLSMEHLPGPSLLNNLLCLGLEEEVVALTRRLGVDLDRLRACERDPALGTGGLGRLASCFLDSLATLGVAAFGYGLRYRYGLFRQEIRDGQQVEVPDDWLRHPSPWEVERDGEAVVVELGAPGAGTAIVGVPFDHPVPGYGNGHVNTLRLWSARSTDGFDLARFNAGDHGGASEGVHRATMVTDVLYPDDHNEAGRVLRLKQELFFVTCSIADILRRYRRLHDDVRALPEWVSIQLNDTHPAAAVTELMRALLDEHGLDWDDAWEITTRTISYTNHTLMPEALEQWPVRLLEPLAPRHVEIVFAINERLCKAVSERHPGDVERLRAVSLVEEGPEKSVRMAHLAVVGSRRVNGVSELHSRLLRERLFPCFSTVWSDRFCNVTNGISQRRWLLEANRPLADLLTVRIGERWITDLAELHRLAPLADDEDFLEQVSGVKAHNKLRLARLINDLDGPVDPHSIFDVQVKRIHEYKRQVLHILAVVHRYLVLKGESPGGEMLARTHIFAGKAASSYAMAKLIIRLIHDVARVINSDPATAGHLRVVFLPDYRVSLAQVIVPAADVSEQISTAGTEASGTGNMKMALNGAVTVGTLDGANIELRDRVGAGNFVLFGRTEGEVEELRPTYRPMDWVSSDARIAAVLEFLGSSAVNQGDSGRYRALLDTLTSVDHFLNLADFASYLTAQEEVGSAYRNGDRWRRMCLANIVGAAAFTSDNSIRGYARRVWGIPEEAGWESPRAPEIASQDCA